jgi:hypothetical protein
MRFKVKLPDGNTYQEIVKILASKGLRIFSASEKRNILSTDCLSEQLVNDIERRGGSVVPEQRYEPEYSAF